ncbi:MAG: hypothetical protein JOY77_07725 [Alphaproteobacteria bacterium]|nr:hypothetical protein [Alphaproteobacteria bacterium]MBV9062805.1 hypothetical protein [Alphaproteobacteria bacterium]
MPKKTVDVFDRSGGRLFSYAIALEEEDCLDAEFEEVALIFAETSGLVAAEEMIHLRARCGGGSPAMDAADQGAGEASSRKSKNNAVLSLVKHRMKRAGLHSAHQRARRVS